MISVFQIFFDEKSEKGLEEAFFPHKNLIDNDFFESNVMRQVYNMNPSFKNGMKYIGISSWKQFQKSHITASEIISRMQKDIDANTAKDVYIYSPIHYLEPTAHPDGSLHGIIRQPDIWHNHKERFEQIVIDTKLLNDAKVLPFDLYDGKWQYCHCNYWIATRQIFDEYCKTVLIPALEFFERPEVQSSMPKWYIHSHTGKKYNSCAFILEGLFGSFLAHSNYTFKYLCKKHYRRKLQWIQIDGQEITNQLITA